MKVNLRTVVNKVNKVLNSEPVKNVEDFFKDKKQAYDKYTIKRILKNYSHRDLDSKSTRDQIATDIMDKLS